MMGDYAERTLECIKRLEAQINQEPGATLDEYLGGSYLCRRFLTQLGEMRRILEYDLHKPTRLEGHRAVHRELHRAMMQIETLMKEWCIPVHHNHERTLGKRREYCRETFLAARWWTMVTAWQAGHGYLPLEYLPFKFAILHAEEKVFDGGVPFMERKGELQVNSQSRPISSYERQLPSVELETWLDEFGIILGKDESLANMALEAIRRADYRVVVTEDMPAIYVDEAKSPLIEEEVTLDLTRDVLGVSRTGAWVIRTKCQGVDCALKRVTDGDNEPVLAHLSHPHIVQLMHYWRKDEYMFLVMELMEGDLTDLLSRHRRANDTLLSVSVAVDILLQTAKGMLYLHDLGIAYPHLSCSNVLFRESGVSQDGGMQYIAKLGGFRNCTWDASGGKEQDVYRFGLFCLEFLTGRRQCEDPLDMVADTRPSIPETIPQVLRFCISSCFDSNVQLGFAQVVTLLLLAQVQVLKSQENEVFLSFGTCEDLDLVQLNQQYSETPSASDADLEKYPVHQLYPEPDVADSDFNPSATLIFFHGFAKSSDEWKSTWMTRNREHVWPKAWLPKDLPGNRILSLSYDIDAPGESPDIGAIEIGKNALRQLVLSSKWKLADPKAKVILIGHSFGGLVIKSLVVEAHNLAFVPGKEETEEPLLMKCPSFLENLEGIVFYSVPGSASQDQQFEKYIVKLNQTGLLQRSSLMQALLKDTRLFNQQMISLCSQFEEIVPEKTQILGFIEGKGMRRIREKQVVVSNASARAQMKKAEFNIVEEDNHFEVCRPVSADHKGYKILVDFLKDKLKIGSLDFSAKKGTHHVLEDVPTDICHPASLFHLDEFVQSETVPTANQQDVPTSNPEDVPTSNPEHVPKNNPQDVPTGNQRLPLGFRFHPSDVELVAYLKEKINGRPIEMNPIAVVDLYKWEPCNLPDKAFLESDNQEWYFYSAWDKEYLNDTRTKFRTKEYGYWKSIGKDRIVRSASSSGFKKTLVYYRGRAPRGERTDWVMHEFRMEDKVYENLTGRQRAYILARVFKKGAAAPVVEEAYSPPLHVDEEEIHFEEDFFKSQPLPESMGKLKCLEYLDLSGCDSLEQLPEIMGELKCLKHLNLSRCGSLKQLPKSMGELKCLKHLDLSTCGSLKQLPESMGELKCLKHLNLSRCGSLEQLPESMGELTCLEHLDLSECRSLKQLPKSMGKLMCLEHLNLSWCESLKQLPESMGELKCLKHLNLSTCGSLEQLPESMGELTCLEHLDLSRCGSLKQLPESMDELKCLKHLNLSRCRSLKHVPKSMGELKCLEHLDFSWCGCLEQLPESMGELTCLEHLDLSKCRSLKQLPDSMGELKCLKHLNLSWCGSLKQLPESMGELKCLTHLDLSWCGSLEQLPESMGELKCLKHLNLSMCRSLKQLPKSMGELKCLEHLDLSNCSSLKQLPKSMDELKCLKHLNISWCRSLEQLPESIGELKCLTHLDLSWCGSLEQLPESMGKLKCLIHLNLSGCASLKQLPEIMGELKCLKHLNLSMCRSLKQLPKSMGELKCLEHLDLSNCSSLKQLPKSMDELKCLKHLNISWCRSLEQLPESMGELKCLTHLDLSWCGSLEQLPESMGKLKCLIHLNLSWCESLKQLPKSMSELMCLEHLNLSRCGSLEQLPESMGELKCLQHLDLSECRSLEQLPESMGELKCLTHLNLSWCESLKQLPESMGELKCLEHLNLSRCGSLEQLPESMGELKCLKHLDLSRCSSLKQLPDSMGELKCLTHMNLSWCRSLKQLLEIMGELKCLTHLNLSGYDSLEQLPESMGELKCLQHLDLSECRSLKQLPKSMDELKCLTHLNLSWCRSLEQLPESMGELKCLKHLDLSRCSSLKQLPESMGELKCLEHLGLSWCGSLEQLPESMDELKCLEHLDLSGCSSLKQLPKSMGELKCLKHLNISWCESLKQLPESMGELKCLEHLDLSSCSSLKQLPESMGELKCLKHLDLSWCGSLKQLPESMGELKCLEHLDLSSCSSLKQLPESMGELKCLKHLDLSWCGSLKQLPESMDNNESYIIR